MEEAKNNFEQLTTHLKEYLETRSRLLLLGLSEKSAGLFSALVLHLVFVFLFLLLLFFGSISLAFWIGQETGSPSLGFGIVTGIYFILVLLVLVLRANANVKRVLEDAFIKMLFGKEKGNEQ